MHTYIHTLYCLHVKSNFPFCSHSLRRTSHTFQHMGCIECGTRCKIRAVHTTHRLLQTIKHCTYIFRILKVSKNLYQLTSNIDTIYPQFKI